MEQLLDTDSALRIPSKQNKLLGETMSWRPEHIYIYLESQNFAAVVE